MWSPTHVQVTVQKARGLIIKGKNGKNDAFVTIALGKDKFQTSIKETASDIEWHEKCDLAIPNQGNRAEIVLTALHRNRMGLDDFLGRVSIPLAEMDVYDRPKNKWFKLGDKPGKDKNKDRGELEVKIGFTVKAGSLSDLSKKEKHKSSLGQLSHAAQSFGGSLISISSLDKRKGLKKLAMKIGSKLPKKSKKNDDLNSEMSSQSGDPDPGVISEIESDDDFNLDELSQKSSAGSLNIAPKQKSVENISPLTIDHTPPKPPRTINSVSPKPEENYRYTPSKAMTLPRKETNPSRSFERIIIGEEVTRSASPVNTLPSDVIKKYSDKSKEDLIKLVVDLQSKLAKETKKQKDLEDYLDQLLLRVMETSPRILQNPYIRRK